MTEVYHATLMRRADAFLAAGEAITHAIVQRVRASTLTVTSGSSFIHPDNGTNIFAGFIDVDLDLVRRFPELRLIDQLNLIIIVSVVSRPSCGRGASGAMMEGTYFPSWGLHVSIRNSRASRTAPPVVARLKAAHR